MATREKNKLGGLKNHDGKTVSLCGYLELTVESLNYAFGELHNWF